MSECRFVIRVSISLTELLCPFLCTLLSVVGYQTEELRSNSWSLKQMSYGTEKLRTERSYGGVPYPYLHLIALCCIANPASRQN